MSSKRFPFNKRVIEAIPANEASSKSREAEYSDAECIGLKLRVSKGGRKFFQHRYRYMGRKKGLTIGDFPMCLSRMPVKGSVSINPCCSKTSILVIKGSQKTKQLETI